MSVIEKLDSVLAKWRANENGDAFDGPDYDRGHAEARLNCADELESLIPAIRQAMIDAERYRWLRDQTLYDVATGEGDQMVWVVTGTHGSDCHPEWGDELDRLVDAGLALNASNEVE